MKVLALDTSTLTGSVALVENGVVAAEMVARVRANHSEALLPMVDVVLARGERTLADVDLLAVGIGPGSFTGVRIGVALAKGLRLSTGKRLAGVRSLDAVASAAVGAEGIVASVLDGRRGEVFVSAWNVDANGARRELLGAMNGAPETMAAEVRRVCGDDRITLTGDLDVALWTRFETALGGASRRLPSVVGAPLARFIAHEAAAGRAVFDDDDSLEPAYVRGSDAKLPGQR